MDLWWMKWHWDRFLEYLVFLLVSIILPVLHTHISFICYWCCTLLAIDSAMKCNTMKRVMVLSRIFGVSLMFPGTCWDTSWEAYTSISASFFLYCHSTFWSCVTCCCHTENIKHCGNRRPRIYSFLILSVNLFCFYCRWLLHLTRIISALLSRKNCRKPLEAGSLHS